MISQVSSPSATEAGKSSEEAPAPTSESGPIRAAEVETPYGRRFWFNYVANLAIMVANSLLFRYADFVTFRGGTEWHLGWIVGLGMVGSLVMRLAQGAGIDQYGARRIWLWSCVGFIGCCLGHIWIERVDGPAIFILRILFSTSVAGIFGASISNVARRTTPARMAEVIGTLGTSGFLGMMLGSLLGDRLFGIGPIALWHIHAMFGLSAALGVVSMGFAWLSTLGQLPPVPRRQPPIRRLLRRFYPGPVLVMGVAMGIGLGVPPVFVRAFTADLGLHGIALFFWVYAPTAFASRIAMRRLPARIGNRNVALLGQAALVASMLAFIAVRNQWQLAAPAVLIGIAHAMLFPSIVATGSGSFPVRFRGLGTTLMLATFDMGSLLGAPLAGMTLHEAKVWDLPRYPTMFFAVAVVMTLAGVYYAWATRASAARALESSRETVEVVPRRRNKPPFARMS